MSKQRNKLTDVEAIRKWYLDKEEEITLTDHQEDVRRRLLQVQALMRAGTANQYIRGVLMKEYGITDRQASRDIRNAIILYGDIRKAEKEGMRYFTYDKIQAAYNLAKVQGSPKDMIAAAALEAKIFALDREDPELPDFEKLQPSLIITVMAPEVEERIVKLLQGGSLDLSKLREQNTIDVEHEEIESRRADQK